MVWPDRRATGAVGRTVPTHDEHDIFDYYKLRRAAHRAQQGVSAQWVRGGRKGAGDQRTGSRGNAMYQADEGEARES